MILKTKREIINLDENSLSKFTCVNDDFDWFSQLIVFVWSKFDSNIDVIEFSNKTKENNHIKRILFRS